MQCSACGMMNRADAKFCDDCGTRLVRTCPTCQHPVRPNAKFCDECGTSLATVPTVVAPVAVAPPLVIEDELRIVTVVFADVSGFTALSETLAPEEVTETMNGCFEAVVAPILRYEGVVDKYVGDAVMARFGAPQAHEDDPERALHAALEMQQAIQNYNAERWPNQPPHLRLRIGINTGEVLAGAVGAVGTQSYTVMGDTVNLASRLEHECPVGSVLVGERTWRAAAHAFEFRALPLLDIRGKSEPVQSYEVLAPKTTRVENRGLVFEHLPLVGRAAEYALVVAALAGLRDGRGGVVAISGEPGIGKTRLLHEAASAVADVRLLVAGNVSYERHAPYGMFRRLLPGLRATAPAAFAALDAECQAALALLEGDPLAPSAAQRQARLEPQARQRELYSAWEAVLGEAAPLAVAFDDLQWADPGSLALLEHLASAALPVLWIAVFRPEPDAAWVQTLERIAQKRPMPSINIVLQGLDAAAIETLLGNMLPIAVFDEQQRAHIAAKADGNPLFAEELARVIIEHGHREGDATSVLALPISDSLQSIIASRIDALPPTSKITLQTGAVIGRSFDVQLLHTVNQAGIDTTRELPQLQRRDFVAPEDETHWEFKHALTQSIAYNSLPRRRRRTLHALIAAHIERDAARSDQHVEQLALHHREAENWEAAFAYYVRAARNAQSIYANSGAITFYEYALGVAAHLAAPEAAAHAAPHEGLADLYLLTGKLSAALDHITTAIALVAPHARRAHERRYAASLHRKHALIHERGGNYPDGKAAVHAGLALVDDQPQAVERAQLLITGGGLHLRTGNTAEALALVTDGLALAEALGSDRDVALGAMYAGLLETDVGHYASAIRKLAQSTSVYHTLGDWVQAAKALNNLGIAYFDSGDWNNALQSWHEAQNLKKQTGDSDGVAGLSLNIGNVYLERGDFAQALQLYQQALEGLTTTRRLLGMSLTHNNLGVTYHRMAQYELAHNHLIEAKQICLKIGAQPQLAEVECHLAEVFIELDELTQALVAAEESLKLASACGLDVQEAATRRVLGQIFMQQGLPEKALAEFQQSIAMYEQRSDAIGAMRTFVQFADYLTAMRTFAQAEQGLLKARSLFTTLGASYDLAMVEQRLQLIFNHR